MDENKNKIESVVSFAKDVDIDSLIEILDYLSCIPALGVVVGILKIILKVLKPFQTSLKTLPVSEGIASSPGIPANAERKIDAMIELAMEDGVLTAEEKRFILKKAEELGLDNDIVELKMAKYK